MLDKVTVETFEPLIGQKFKLTLPDAQVLELELVDVEELPTGRRRRNAPEPRRKPFSIFFTGQPLLPQAIYPLQHDALGAEPLTIFIVPVGEVEGGYEYEAVFT
ncbi:MAG TPA: hypothetical protein VEK57_22980 [Thermoanaerobaculia bacterium]|nr:hypothetical protein [Thermoanaerobaculia bacterium]